MNQYKLNIAELIEVMVRRKGIFIWHWSYQPYECHNKMIVSGSTKWRLWTSNTISYQFSHQSIHTNYKGTPNLASWLLKLSFSNQTQKYKEPWTHFLELKFANEFTMWNPSINCCRCCGLLLLSRMKAFVYKMNDTHIQMKPEYFICSFIIRNWIAWKMSIPKWQIQSYVARTHTHTSKH